VHCQIQFAERLQYIDYGCCIQLRGHSARLMNTPDWCTDKGRALNHRAKLQHISTDENSRAAGSPWPRLKRVRTGAGEGQSRARGREGTTTPGQHTRRSVLPSCCHPKRIPHSLPHKKRRTGRRTPRCARSALCAGAVLVCAHGCAMITIGMYTCLSIFNNETRPGNEE